MTTSVSTLTSSFSSLSFSSQISQKPISPKSLQFPKTHKKTHSLTVLATALVEPVVTARGDNLETINIEKYVKSRLPGGFAAQTLIGTGRRKCAIARVVIQEGSGKFIINYRDAKLISSL
ncbi:30S ribosomal protein S9, chloroplastic [Tanacetum coccineum]